MSKNTLTKQDYSEIEITKIRQLIWSNSVENDLLVLELLKNNGFPASLELDIISVALTTEAERIKLAYRNFLKRQLPEDKFCKIPAIKFRSFNSSLCTQLAQLFSVDALIYTYYQRTGLGIEDFLQYGGNTSDYRPEIFKAYLKKLKHNLLVRYRYKQLNIIGLTLQELAFVFEDEAISTTSIHRIMLNNCAVKSLPEAIFSISGVRDLDFRNLPLKKFPVGLFQMNQLRKLRFFGTRFSSIPADWGSLKELTSLSFQGSKVSIEHFDFVATLPKLKELDLGNSTLSTPYLLCTKKTLPLVHWNNYSSIGKYPLKNFLVFASAVNRSMLSTKDQIFFFDIVRKLPKIKDFPDLSFNQLLKALTINYAPLRDICLKRLESMTLRLNGIASLEKNAVVHIIGGTTMKKTEIRHKLKALAIHYSPKFSATVTHVLIGKNPKNFQKTSDQTVKIITENQLQKFFSENQPQYLEQAAQSATKQVVQENLTALLTSADSTNAMLGIEMLKSGGVPPDIMETLLVTQKTNTDSKVRTAAKKLLELYAPAEWLPLIRDKQHFAMIGKKIREQDLNIKLEKIAKKTSKELAAMLSLALFKIHRKGLRYVLYHFITPHPNRTKAFQALMEGTHCDYRAGLGFRNLKERAPNSFFMWKMKVPATFPADILEVIDKVESIDFHNCKFDKLHQSIGKFTDLKQLNCSCNTIKKLPKTIRHLKNLETLDLSNNVFKEFPMEVLSLPNLKKLDLRHMHNYQNNTLYSLEIPEAVKIQMPDCEVLV